MKKLLLFFAALCCALGVSAEKTFYDVLPSGTGVHERTIVNMEYDIDAQTLSFDDTYIPSFTAYQRMYFVYFSEWKPEYKYWVNASGGQPIVYYGDDAHSSLVKSPNGKQQPSSQWFTRKVDNNSNGGHVTIDLKSAIETLKSVSSSTDFLVSVGADYAVAPEANIVDYSIYGGSWEASFLLNSKHISLVANNISVSAQMVRDHGMNLKGETLRPNGVDMAVMCANISMDREVNADVNYVWEYCDDDDTQWKELSRGTVSKNDFNKNAEKEKIPTCSVSFTSTDRPNEVRRVRVTISTDDPAVIVKTDDEPVSLHVGTMPTELCDISVSPVIVRVKNDQGIAAPENPKSVEIAINGTDAAQVGAEITLSKNVGSDVKYVWEYLDDNKNQWKELSSGVVSKDDFNGFASNRKVPFATVSFTADNKPINVRLVRVRLSTDDSAVSVTYDNPVEIGVNIPLVEYPLYIYDVQVTSRNCDVLGQTSDRYIKYDAATNTLSMNDVTLQEEQSGVDVIAYYGKDPLNIYIQGKSYLYNFTDHNAIYSENADVKIYGDGSLTIVNSDTPTGGITIDGNLAVSDGAKLWIRDFLKAKKAFGISLYGDGVLTVDYATIEVEGTPAIWNVKDIVMKNGVNILSAGHKFDAAKKAVVDASGNATSETVLIGVGTPDAIQNVVTEKASQNGKFVRNNQLVIKRGDEYYNAQGVVVK